jgi:transcriptional regulator with XRE-family HTH domain
MTKTQQKDMANRIKAKRKAAGYTQDTFSEAVGLSLSSYSKIENAFQCPSLDSIMRIADKLNLPIDYLVYGFERTMPEKGDFTSLLEFADDKMLQHTCEFIGKITKMKKGY